MITGPQSHCHFDGTAYVRAQPDQEWPRKCPKCGNLQWFNPTPIGVLIQPVTDGGRTGVLTPIRGGNPQRGEPALTGGFQEGFDQSSEDAGCRELWEEIKLARVREDEIELLCSRSTGPFIPGRRQNLVFGVNPNPIPLSMLDAFVPDAETLAIEISWGPRVLAFPSHTYALAKYFQRYHGVTPPQAHLLQPRTGDIIKMDGLRLPIFNIPYVQPQVDEGRWLVEIEQGQNPVAVLPEDGGWIAA